jgi:hypothetical protein
MARIALLITIGALVSGYAWQSSQMAKLASLAGSWDVQLEIKEPKELARTHNGQATISWGPNKSSLRIEASMKAGARTNHFAGTIAFDDAAAYDLRCYRAVFTWDNDGRMLPMKGDFAGLPLVLEGKPFASDETKDMTFRATSDIQANKVLVQVDAKRADNYVRVFELTFTRKTL